MSTDLHINTVQELDIQLFDAVRGARYGLERASIVLDAFMADQIRRELAKQARLGVELNRDDLEIETRRALGLPAYRFVDETPGTLAADLLGIFGVLPAARMFELIRLAVGSAVRTLNIENPPTRSFRSILGRRWRRVTP